MSSQVPKETVADTDGQRDHPARHSSPKHKFEPGYAFVDGDIDGPGYNETLVDIIAVPCPGASPIDTWCRDGLADGYFDTPSSDLHKYPTAKLLAESSILFPGISRPLPNAKDLWVLQGIRTEVSIARVLLYSHRDLSNGITLEQLANDLLSHICQIREGRRGSRPIIFICHSIGGLVAKLALVKAWRDEKLRWILFDCHGITFFATPHRGSGYLSVPGLRDSIQSLLYLSQPLPLSISDELRVNHRSLLELNDQFMEFTSEMRIWTFYETRNSQLSGLGLSNLNEVHFSAPLVSIKSALVLNKHEQVSPLESEHANVASFGQGNLHIMESFLKDLGQFVRKAAKLSTTYVHTPLRLSERVKVELMGFYDDPDPEIMSDVRLYVSKHNLSEFLDKGPERCLSERLSTIGPKPRRADYEKASRARSVSPGKLSHPEELGVWSKLSDSVHMILNPGSAQAGSFHGSPEAEEGPEVIVTRPIQHKHVTQLRTEPSQPTIDSQNIDGKTVRPLKSQSLPQPHDLSSSLDPGTYSDGNARKSPNLRGFDNSQHGFEMATLLGPGSTHDIEDGIDEPDIDVRPRRRKGRTGRPADARQDLTPGFSRPDPTRRKFIWIHLPYTNPYWVKCIFEKLAETQPFNYAKLFGNESWFDRHIQGINGQNSYVKPGCGFVPAEAHSQRSYSLGPSIGKTPKLDSPDHLYLYLPYLHFDTYKNVIRRRQIMHRRMAHGRTRPVPQDVADMSMEMRVIWEFIGHDLPLNTRRTLDQYGYPSLQNTYTRDDDQMLYKLTKEQVSGPFGKEKTGLFKASAMREQLSGSSADGFASVVEEANMELLMHTDYKTAEDEIQAAILDGNLLMVDQLWLWAVDLTTVTTFFPKRESHSTEGSMFQQGDLRNSISNELNGDLVGRCENALDLAAMITLHAVTVLLDRTSHPELEIFRIFEEAIGILTESMTSSLKRFRMQTSLDRIHDPEYNDNRSESIKQRHRRELEQAERGIRENTSALIELRDMGDELMTLSRLFEEQTTVVETMQNLYNRSELRDYTHNGRRFLSEALSRLQEYQRQVDNMMARISNVRIDYDKLIEMLRKVDEVRWSRLQTELASAQNRSVIIFTTFTVIFLPLSFFTSLFGMNTSDWAGADGNNYTSLSTIGAISLPSSFVIVALALVAAFSIRAQAVVKTGSRVMKNQWNSAKKIWTGALTESQIRRKWLMQEREGSDKANSERGYDFWETMRMKRTNEHEIPELNLRSTLRKRGL